MAAGPEVAALIDDFEDAPQLMGRRDEVLHHDQRASVQNAFRKEVCDEESEYLLVLDSKYIADASAVEVAKKA